MEQRYGHLFARRVYPDVDCLRLLGDLLGRESYARAPSGSVALRLATVCLLVLLRSLLLGPPLLLTSLFLKCGEC